MAQIIINNGDSGLTAREAINGNFTELYQAAVLPLRVPGITANTAKDIPANSFVNNIFLFATIGTPLIRIGTAPNGTDIMPDTAVGSFNQQFSLQEYFQTATTFYISISGVGFVNIRIEILYNFY